MNTAQQLAKQHCLQLLARREHSQVELRLKLTQKNISHEDIEAVLGELAEKDLQSDRRFMESFVRSRLQKGYGKLLIISELRKKGISFAENIDDILLTQAGSWDDLLTRVYLKKYRSFEPVACLEWAKRQRFLYSRGFSSEQIQQFARRFSLFS